MSEDLESLFYKVIDYLDGKESDCRKSTPNVEENSKSRRFGRNVIPLGVSNRHIHLSQEHAVALFGQEYVFHKLKDLSQKGQCAYQECVTLVGPKESLKS